MRARYSCGMRKRIAHGPASAGVPLVMTETASLSVSRISVHVSLVLSVRDEDPTQWRGRTHGGEQPRSARVSAALWGRATRAVQRVRSIVQKLRRDADSLASSGASTCSFAPHPRPTAAFSHPFPVVARSAGPGVRGTDRRSSQACT